ncbi:hypothetical protein HS7_04510 [Sulfolobales archaeon HS-7]|nr:hypothetical protein HS7_04510 [Sulfolobales archaeon HS-7]
MEDRQLNALFLFGISTLALFVGEVIWVLTQYTNPLLDVGVPSILLLTYSVTFLLSTVPGFPDKIRLPKKYYRLTISILLFLSNSLPVALYGRLEAICIPIVSVVIIALWYFTDNKLYVIALFILNLAIIFLGNYPWVGNFSDEYAIGLCAALQLLHGLNPYLPSVTAHALTRFNVPTRYQTPTLYGKVVTFVNYPAMSFLIYVLPLITNIPPELFLFIIPVIFIVVLSRDLPGDTLAGITAIMLLNMQWFTFKSPPPVDFLWSFSLGIASYFLFKRKFSTAGALYGLSLSFKQIGAYALFPLAYFVFREGGKKSLISSAFSCVGIFLLTNLPFLVMNPTIYLHDVLTPISGDLIGIGSGISQLSFLGIYYMPPIYYTFVQFFFLIILWISYAKYYEKLKYALFGLPVLPLLFNYRVLISYLLLWIIPSSIPLIKATEARSTEISIPRKAIVALGILLLVTPMVGGVTVHQEYTQYYNVVKVKIEKVFANRGSIIGVLVTVTYQPIPGLPNRTFLLFRGFSPENVIKLQKYNENGIMLQPIFNYSYIANKSYEVMLEPQGHLFAMKDLYIIAYYGYIQGSAFVDFSNTTTVVNVSGGNLIVRK